MAVREPPLSGLNTSKTPNTPNTLLRRLITTPPPPTRCRSSPRFCTPGYQTRCSTAIVCHRLFSEGYVYFPHSFPQRQVSLQTWQTPTNCDTFPRGPLANEHNLLHLTRHLDYPPWLALDVLHPHGRRVWPLRAMFRVSTPSPPPKISCIFPS